jgi:hypothetical protein
MTQARRKETAADADTEGQGRDASTTPSPEPAAIANPLASAADDQALTSRDDRRAASVLRDLLTGLPDFSYRTLSLSQWRTESTALLEDQDVASTLFLFDRDFRKEQASQDEGLELVRELQNKAVGYCGLIN